MLHPSDRQPIHKGRRDCSEVAENRTRDGWNCPLSIPPTQRQGQVLCAPPPRRSPDQVALLPNITKSKKFLDDIFRDANELSRGGTEVCGAKKS